jgi:hypothetical protein
MPDGAIAVRECKASLNQLPIHLIKEAEFNGVGCITPDGEVCSALGDGGPKGAGVGRQHEGYLALFSDCESTYSSVTCAV